MKKIIELEVEFPDGFVPPEKFDRNLCTGDCPFLTYEADECSEVFCCLVGAEGECPIKNFFN